VNEAERASSMFSNLWDKAKKILRLNEVCRFSEECPLYQENHDICNKQSERFVGSGKSFCGKYRNLASS